VSVADFNKLLDGINKQYGGQRIVRAKGCKSIERIRRLPTGMFAYDLMSGGGTPMGRMTVYKGGESAGKTALAIKSAAAFQRTCRNCLKPIYEWDEIHMTKTPIRCCKSPEPMRVVWFDAENSWENFWSERLGMDTANTFVIKTEFAEQGIDVADSVIRSGECDLLVVDSVAALTPSVEIEQSSEKQQMGVHARLMNKAMRKWTSAQNAPGLDVPLICTVILINQVRQNLSGYGSPETTPGGKGIGFHASIIGKAKRTDTLLDASERPIGHALEMYFEKNKTSPPRRTAAIKLFFVDHGEQAPGSTDYAEQVGRYASFWNLIQQSGSWFELAKDVKVQGIDKVGQYLAEKEHAPLLKKLAAEIWKLELGWRDGTALDETA